MISASRSKAVGPRPARASEVLAGHFVITPLDLEVIVLRSPEAAPEEVGEGIGMPPEANTFAAATRQKSSSVLILLPIVSGQLSGRGINLCPSS
ncbi:hypothetical protein ACQ4WX_40010 [Streptomyces lasalocidi]